MKLLLSILCFSICAFASAQNTSTLFTKVDSSNFKKIYPHALRGDMGAVFEMLKMIDDHALTPQQQTKKRLYYQRFLYRTEDFDYNTNDIEIIDLYNRFQNYWRSIIIEHVPQNLADSLFRDEMTYFLKKYYKPELDIETIDNEYYALFQDYFRSKNMYGIAMGKTGHLYDLYLWKEQEERVYKIDLPEEQSVEVPIVFMRDFISNGWSHYTTLAHSYTGGWAAADKLFCVEESYGPKDEEEFIISYISHEGQHFSDYTLFPKLKQADLEYRAKLTELALAQTTTHKIIDKFIANAKKDKSYAHAYANYMVVEFLSNKVFNTSFESDPERWKRVSIKEINKISLGLLKEHSRILKALGAESVKGYITTL